MTNTPPTKDLQLPTVDVELDESALAPVEAQTDDEIVRLYLREVRDMGYSPRTIRVYEVILRRFLAWWKAYAPERTLPAFRREHVLEYREFMRDPPTSWIGEKRPRRKKDGSPNPEYRPFQNPLSET